MKYEDRPDYSTLKYLFYDLLISQISITNNTIFTFDWFNDDTPQDEANNINDSIVNQTFAGGYFKNNKTNTFAPNENLIKLGESQISEINNINKENNFSKIKIFNK